MKPPDNISALRRSLQRRVGRWVCSQRPGGDWRVSRYNYERGVVESFPPTPSATVAHALCKAMNEEAPNGPKLSDGGWRRKG